MIREEIINRIKELIENNGDEKEINRLITSALNMPIEALSDEKDGYVRCSLCGRSHKINGKNNKCYYCGQVLDIGIG